MGQKEILELSPVSDDFSGGINKCIYEKRKNKWINTSKWGINTKHQNSYDEEKNTDFFSCIS